MSQIKIFALGGLNEVGKNTYCIECNDEMIIIDAGVKFASEGLPGIDYVIPDYQYLIDNQPHTMNPLQSPESALAL